VSSRKGHQGLPVETHPHELASAQATQGPRASEEDALLFFGRADPVPQTPKNSEDNRGSERHRRPRDDTPLPRVVTGDWPLVLILRHQAQRTSVNRGRAAIAKANTTHVHDLDSPPSLGGRDRGKRIRPRSVTSRRASMRQATCQRAVRQPQFGQAMVCGLPSRLIGTETLSILASICIARRNNLGNMRTLRRTEPLSEREQVRGLRTKRLRDVPGDPCRVADLQRSSRPGTAGGATRPRRYVQPGIAGRLRPS